MKNSVTFCWETVSKPLKPQSRYQIKISDRQIMWQDKNKNIKDGKFPKMMSAFRFYLFLTFVGTKNGQTKNCSSKNIASKKTHTHTHIFTKAASTIFREINRTLFNKSEKCEQNKRHEFYNHDLHWNKNVGLITLK